MISKFFINHSNKFILLIASLIGFGFIYNSYQYAILRQWDFFVYYLASNAIFNNLNPYNPDILKDISSNIFGIGYAGLPYLYSPLMAWLILPIAQFPPYSAAFIWLLLKCISLEIIVLISLKLLRLPFSLFWLVIAHVLCIYFRPFALDFNSGNVAIFESMLVLIFFLSMRTNHYFISSLSLCLSSIFKGYPVLLALYPIHLRDWKFITYFIGVGIFLLCISVFAWENMINWIKYFNSDSWKMMWDEQVQSYYNCSSTTVILRTFSETYFAEPIIKSNLAVLILVPLFPVIIFLLFGLALKKYLADNYSDLYCPEVISLLMCTLLLLPPRLAGYTLAWLYFPILTSFIKSIEYKNYISLILSIPAFFLLQMNIAPEHVPLGITQLLIDKDFFGLLFLYISLLWIVIHKTNGKMINQN